MRLITPGFFPASPWITGLINKRESVARARSTELMRDSRQVKKQYAEDDVNGEKLDAFDPVRFPVAADLKQDVNRSDDGEDFRPRKLEVHRLAKQVGRE
jgi:hypothetical protein